MQTGHRQLDRHVNCETRTGTQQGNETLTRETFVCVLGCKCVLGQHTPGFRETETMKATEHYKNQPNYMPQLINNLVGYYLGQRDSSHRERNCQENKCKHILYYVYK